MRVCPSCSSEYVDAISHCKKCDVDTVEPGELDDATIDVGDNPREILADVELAHLPARTLDGARELEAELQNAGIVCYVHAEQTAGAMLSAGSIQYLVAVAREDIEEIEVLLEGRYQQLLEREGVAGISDAVVDLEAEEVTCPACGHTGALDDEGACADCGLVLGVG